MSCPFNPADCVAGVAKTVATDAFGSIAADFGRAADGAINWLWAQLGSATAVSLTGKGFRADIGIAAGIAVVVAVGLFAVQIITSTLRRDPGGLARAGKGLLVAFLGTAVAIGVLQVTLRAVDDLSAGVVSVTTGGSITQMGHGLLAAGAITSATANPAGVIVLSLAALGAVVVVWAALMIRKVLVVVTAVFAPLAFAGSLADVTVAWARRWIEATAALVASKLVLVIIFVVGLGMATSGVGQAGSGSTQLLTQTASGILVLVLAGLAPWMALRIVHFVGDHAQTLHGMASASTAGASRVYSSAQKAQPWVARAVRGAQGTAAMGAAAMPGPMAGEVSPPRAQAASAPPGGVAPTRPGAVVPSPPPPRPTAPATASVSAPPPPERQPLPAPPHPQPPRRPGPSTSSS